MSIINAIAAQRQKLLDGIDANEGDINLRIFEDFYPDEAHFIYELLQNAEDAGATEVVFELHEHSCSFQHNGSRHFNERDIRGITGIFNSSKSKDSDKIGKFGVGFKSVFVYTDTPIVYSQDFSFKILKLVLPQEVPSKPGLAALTRFEFPFNNPKKAARTAFAEVKSGLEKLSETTLLFLNNLRYIRWRVGSQEGEVLRDEHGGAHVEVLKQLDGREVVSSHWLRFSEPIANVAQYTAPVSGVEHQKVSVAFELHLVGDAKSFDKAKPLAKQMKIVPAVHGTVSVFFPAEKEASGLRYHLHAPFVPELSRASIKSTPENTPLFEQLGGLSARSLHGIKDLGLLTTDFLAVLPSNDDPLPDRYRVIRTAVIKEMKTQPLVPTVGGSHAPAARLCQARATLKALLSDEDLAFVTGRQDQPTWVINASQRNQAQDKFLNSLEIASWDVEELKDFLEKRARKCNNSWDDARVDPLVLKWMSGKTLEWHQALYAVLHKYCEDEGDTFDLRETQIVRMVDGTYEVATDAYFQTGVPSKKDPLPRVNEEIFTVGMRRNQQAEARKFLTDIGVKMPGELEEVTLLLKSRYGREGSEPPDKVYLADLKRLMAFAERNPQSRDLLASACLFRIKGPDFTWGQAEHAYVDAPIFKTGLGVYYKSITDDSGRRWPLSSWYQDQDISIEKFAKFALFAGVEHEFQGLWVQTDCSGNEKYRYLQQVDGERYTSSIDRDYAISKRAAQMLHLRLLEGSRLVWVTMNTAPSEVLKARYRKNASGGSRYADSQLICRLRDSAWVPQRDGSFVTPRQATAARLPEGFSYDLSYQWLQPVEFGADERKRSADSTAKAAKRAELGFATDAAYERALQFSKLPEEEQESLLERAKDLEDEPNELPERPVSNADLRAGRVGEQARLTPAKEAEVRARSVQLGVVAAKITSKQYLEDQYRDKSGHLICQVCKEKMPFKLASGAYYFEAVEVVADARQRYRETYLALCPNHAAAYRYANAQRDQMENLIATASGSEVEIELGGKSTTIYFTQMHLADMRACLLSDQ